MGLLPAKLTAEEQALLNKFALLKKKRKTSNQVKSVSESTNTNQTPKKESASENNVTNITPSIVPKDAKEIAKRLIASGQLKINKNPDNRSFKRARSSVSTEKKTREPSISEAAFASKEQSKKIETVKSKPYNNFVSSGHQKPEEDNNQDQYKWSRNNNHRRQQGNTVFVAACGLTKKRLDTHFPKFGQVVNIYMDVDKGHGFVTYQSRESCEEAIKELHGTLVEGKTIRVMFARKRPYDDNKRTFRPNFVRPDAMMDPKKDNERRADGPRAVNRLANTSPSKPKQVKQTPKDQGLVTYEGDDFDF